VPDADDTAGALVALHVLRGGESCDEVAGGVEWLLGLQNRDGGMPTFCKGWGRLPFDRSSPDISAHAILAFTLWIDALPDRLRTRCGNSVRRMLSWMERAQGADGSWVPLWFGDQDAPGESSPVYGTATAVEYLSASREPLAQGMTTKGLEYLLAAQNPDGGWGGAPGVVSKVTLTARALGALAGRPGAETASERAADFLHSRFEADALTVAEPIGLYFSRLWYSEELYNLTFAMTALKKYDKG
jgi:squalene-hopene/tetraprenyl-beta-curcumene cyclase